MPQDLGTHDPTGAPEEPSLEERLRCLEDAVAQLQETRKQDAQSGEQRDLRITGRLEEPADPPHVLTMRKPVAMVIEPSRQLIPAAIRVMPEPAAASRRADPFRGPRQLLDLYADLRAMWCMFFDPRYQLSWQVRLLPLLFVAAILTSSFWVPGVALLPGILATPLDKFVDLILAFFLYRILSREARRYRETAPDLPESLRL